LAWVEGTLLLGSDGKGEMAVVDSNLIDKNREGFREAWSIGLGGEIDGTLEDTDMHHWDKVLETSLFGMEQYLDIYNGTFVNENTEIHEELGHPFLSSSMQSEDGNSGMSFGQGRYGGVVNVEFPSPTYVDDNMSSKTSGMTTCISSFLG
jgi:hypothetical protein